MMPRQKLEEERAERPEVAKLLLRIGMIILACSSLLISGAAGSEVDWYLREVTEVNGTFENFQTKRGFEVGEGTSRIQWGDAITFPSFLKFTGYDAFPGWDQEWYSPGQEVYSGSPFLVGSIEFGNGSVSGSSSEAYPTVDLRLTAFGSEFFFDYHPMLVSDTWRIQIVQTLNTGDRYADADFFYFRDHPELGSFRVFEERSSSIELYATFGSIIPVWFGFFADTANGFWSQSVDVFDPQPPTPPAAVPEPSTVFLTGIAGVIGLGIALLRRRA